MRTSRRFRAAWPVAGLALASACSLPIISDRDETVPVPPAASWAWAPPGARDSTWGREGYENHPAFTNEILLQRFKRAIEAKMQAKGFRQVLDGEDPDFYLSLHLGVSRGPRSRTAAVGVGVGVGWGGRGGGWGWGGPRPGWGWYSPYSWSWGWYGPPIWGGAAYVPYPVDRLDGGIIVALLRERSSGQVAWRGQYNADVYDAHRMSEPRIRKVVDKLFEEL